MSDNQQKMIPIKKADGTIERVTFAEFQKRQSSAKSAPPAPPADDKSVAKITPPHKPTPRPSIAPAPKKRDDFHITLAEPLSGVSTLSPITSDSRLPEVEKIFRKLRFTAPQPDRLKNIIQARVKGIRDEEATRQKLSGDIKQGGAGLTREQTEEVLKLCRLTMGQKAAGDLRMVAPLKPSVASPAVLPAPHAPPVKSSSEKMFVEQRSLSGQVDNIADLIKKNSTAVSPSSAPAIRSVVRDVVAPIPVSGVGPVDEIGKFTLTDFRRLSAKTAEATARLKQKFLALKEESYLFYIKGLTAWRQSPLYLAYTEKIMEALNKKIALADVLTASEGIKLAEIQAILRMEKELD